MTILDGWPGTKNETENTGHTETNWQFTMGVIIRGNRVIILKVLIRIHASHLGAEGCLCKARDVIYWATINSEVKDFISFCTACSDYLQNSSKGPLISHPIPSKPWS